MNYFYLQVDRLDDETVCPLYFPMGTNQNRLDHLIAAMLNVYRRQGFKIVHYPDRPSYKRAFRQEDGVKLEIIVIRRETPLEAGGHDAPATL